MQIRPPGYRVARAVGLSSAMIVPDFREMIRTRSAENRGGARR